jgi:small subunit ribosomal protein S4e
MKHQKRNKAPKFWGVKKKGTKFVGMASHANSSGIPLVVALRDILKIAKTKKEVRYFSLNGDVKVNSKIRKDETFPLLFNDIISLEKLHKSYRVGIKSGKFILEETDSKTADKKIVKVSGKKIIGKDKTQMNLEDGQNILTKEKFCVGDSIILNNNSGKIEKVLSLKKGAKIEVIAGKHAGEKGVLEEIKQLKREKSYLIKLEDKEVTLPLKTFLVVG